MPTPFLHTAVLAALLAVSPLALADPPTLVGRVSLTEGQVTLSDEGGNESDGALLNWPVTSRNRIATAPGARAEFRVGSTAVRLDGDSALEVTEMDADSLRLHLHYGSVSVRVRNQDMVRALQLATPQGRITMNEPGVLRIDAERVPDTTVVHVLAGSAQVEGGGASLTLRPGRRAEIANDDVRTGGALEDDFDAWAALRDRHDEGRIATRYVSSELTGYEELDRHGAWRDSIEYGTVWTPRGLPADWAPYRYGRWTWVAPWGWTWIDNAPWGYAPSHYGRWVLLDRRWCWAPGRRIHRPVWAPALVGWIGGSGWQVSFGSGARRPALGWYPLSPREAYVPGYRASPEHISQINLYLPGERRRGREHDHDYRQRGMTVVPHEHFRTRGTVAVTHAPRTVMPAPLMQAAPSAPPPAPAVPQVRARNAWGSRDDTRRQPVERQGHDGAGATIQAAAPVRAPQPLTSRPPAAPAPQVQPLEPQRMRGGRPDRWDQRDDEPGGRRQAPVLQPRIVQPAAAPLPAPAPQPPAPMFQAQPAQPPAAQPQPQVQRLRGGRPERWDEDDGARRQVPAFQQRQVQPAMPVQAAPQPVHPAPRPQAMPQPQPLPQAQRMQPPQQTQPQQERPARERSRDKVNDLESQQPKRDWN